MTRSDQPAVDDIKHDPDPLLTSMMNLMWRYDKDPSADALVDVLNEAAAEIELLRTALNVAAGEISRAEMYWNMTPKELADHYIHIAQTIIELNGPTRTGEPQ